MIILVRHGQTEANASALLQGRSNRSLSELGRAQAAALAECLGTRAGARVVSSPLARATETAAAIAARLGAEVKVEEALIELDYGDWDGRAVADISAHDWARWRADPSFAPPSGESLLALGARVESWLRQQIAADQILIAVSHMSPIKVAACVALGVDVSASWRMHLDVASLTRLARRQGTVMLASFNETPAAGAGVPNSQYGNGAPEPS